MEMTQPDVTDHEYIEAFDKLNKINLLSQDEEPKKPCAAKCAAVQEWGIILSWDII